jgi:hypothetical protein
VFSEGKTPMDLNLQTFANLETISDMFEEGLEGLVAACSIA